MLFTDNEIIIYILEFQPLSYPQLPLIDLKMELTAKLTTGFISGFPTKHRTWQLKYPRNCRHTKNLDRSISNPD